jgi:hypothetical protein
MSNKQNEPLSNEQVNKVLNAAPNKSTNMYVDFIATATPDEIEVVLKLAEMLKGANKPANNKPANNKPANNKPANNKPANNKPANNKPANNKPANNKPANNKPANNKPANNKPANVKEPMQQGGKRKTRRARKDRKGSRKH